MMRKTVAGIILLMMLGTAAGSSFGSFSSKTSVQTDSRSATFTVSTLNLGNENLNVKVESYDVDSDLNIDVLTPTGNNPFTLQPSEVTSNPSDSKTWFVLKNGEYAETQRVRIRAVFDQERPDNQASFKVRLQASPSSADSESSDENTTNPSQSVVQVRSYSYTVSTSTSRNAQASADEETSNNTQSFSSFVQSFTRSFNSIVGSVSRDQGGGGQPDIRVQDDKNQEQDSGTQDTSPDTTSPSSGDSENTTSPTGSFFSQVNPVTPVLLIAALGSVAYLLRVM